MKKLFILLSFIPWLLYFFYQGRNALKDLKNNKISKEWFKTNFLNIFHLDNLILLGIFLYFSNVYHSSNQIFLTKLLLFSCINLYLFTNRYYDKNRNKNRIGAEDISTVLIIIILAFVPISFYNLTGNYTIAYYIMFGFSFFNYLIVYLAKKINDLILKIVGREKR